VVVGSRKSYLPGGCKTSHGLASRYGQFTPALGPTDPNTEFFQQFKDSMSSSGSSIVRSSGWLLKFAIAFSANDFLRSDSGLFHVKRLGGDGIMIVVEICHLYISPGHNFVGHYGREPDEFSTIEVPTIECVAGRGIRGDRYFDFKEADHFFLAGSFR
jgi:hypothetical protein